MRPKDQKTKRPRGDWGGRCEAEGTKEGTGEGEGKESREGRGGNWGGLRKGDALDSREQKGDIRDIVFLTKERGGVHAVAVGVCRCRQDAGRAFTSSGAWAPREAWPREQQQPCDDEAT